jgi:hypothetical protein
LKLVSRLTSFAAKSEPDCDCVQLPFRFWKGHKDGRHCILSSGLKKTKAKPGAYSGRMINDNECRAETNMNTGFDFTSSFISKCVLIQFDFVSYRLHRADDDPKLLRAVRCALRRRQPAPRRRGRIRATGTHFTKYGSDLTHSFPRHRT